MSQSVISTSQPATVIQRKHEACSGINAWLLWKETRQILPLMLTLLAVMFALPILFFVLGGRLLSRDLALILLLVFPGLFATGAGALLVGQERYDRTIEWLSMLPVRPKSIWLTKLFVGAVAFALMWIVAIVFLKILRPNTASIWRNASTLRLYGEVSWIFIAHSYFILICGFLTSWRIHYPLYAIFAILPLALLPFISSSILSELMRGDQRYWPETQSSVTEIASLVF